MYWDALVLYASHFKLSMCFYIALQDNLRIELSQIYRSTAFTTSVVHVASSERQSSNVSSQLA
jgi:hypothetical protein